MSTGTTLKVRSNNIHVYTIWGKFNIKLSLGLIEHNLVLKPAVSMFGCETRKWAGRAWVGTVSYDGTSAQHKAPAAHSVWQHRTIYGTAVSCAMLPCGW